MKSAEPGGNFRSCSVESSFFALVLSGSQALQLKGGEMEHQERRRQILDQMTQIECMEKGKLSEEYREKHKDGERVRRRPHYNHQCWEDGCTYTAKML